MKKFSSGYIHSIETMGLVDGPGIYKISVPKDMLSGCLTHLGELLIN